MMVQGENKGGIIPSPGRHLAFQGGSLAKRGLQLTVALADRHLKAAVPSLITLDPDVYSALMVIGCYHFEAGLHGEAWSQAILDDVGDLGPKIAPHLDSIWKNVQDLFSAIEDITSKIEQELAKGRAFRDLGDHVQQLAQEFADAGLIEEEPQSLLRNVLSNLNPKISLNEMTEVLSRCGKVRRLTKDVDLGNNVTMKFVLISSGMFLMGSPRAEQEGIASDMRKAGFKGGFDHSREGPQREVTISKPFYMGVYVVTREQYEQVTGEDLSSRIIKSGEEPSKHKASCAAQCISWNEAIEFCRRVSQKTGRIVRLPTEAEWEYACRAGSTTRFYYGDDDDYSELKDYACYDGDIPPAVGEKKPNNWGLYDMHGLVSEWCADWYTNSFANAETVDPLGPPSGTERVIRGAGALDYFPDVFRSAARGGSSPDFHCITLGFRVVMELSPGDRAVHSG